MKRLLPVLVLTALALLPGCAFHDLARNWNGRVGPEGEPLYFASVTKVGMNLFIIIPLFGNVQIDGMIDELTSQISDAGGDNVTVVQGSTENYWYGFSPLTWIFTPILSELSATYRPSPKVYAEDVSKGELTPVQDDTPTDAAGGTPADGGADDTGSSVEPDDGADAPRPRGP